MSTTDATSSTHHSAPRSSATTDEVKARSQERPRARPTSCRCRGSRRSSSTWVSAGPRQQPSLLEGAVADLTAITGQKPIVTKARRLDRRLQAPRGPVDRRKVTLRGDRMWEFLDRLISVAIPRIRDFAACRPTAGTAGATTRSALSEQIMFPRSTTTRSTRPWAWTSPSSPRRRHQRRRARRCSMRSASRSSGSRRSSAGDQRAGAARGTAFAGGKARKK